MEKPIRPEPERPAPASPQPDHWRKLESLERLADNLDSRYRVPGTSIRFGWDSILGLIPGLGDVAPLGPAGYILLQAHRMGVPTATKARMGVNVAADAVIGTIPLVGDLFDVALKANRRNVALIRDHLERTHPSETPPAPPADPGPSL